ncbi:RES family NAD+ phosphorylase [Devosia algicola]|uniref:RES family NAD+ phosphorylase n=1 Tax=Devosia algicola TaxID=3026418 RepID=A0ABY7YMW3_9HYPH|nr:RES family NAD+ phosphorylase [Devosia algicola]WDR02661.1 RES family NAD+ phosphorylase [Devosia algicola]
MNPPFVAVAEQATVRLIPTAYYKPPVLRPLVDDDDEMEILAVIEGLTNRRQRAEQSGLRDLDPRELIFRAWGQTHINAAFAYTRPEGNRFNDAGRGAWYCAFDDLTAIAEVAYHRTRELQRINHFVDEAIYQVLLAGFLGDFRDLRGMDSGEPFLAADPAIAYPAGQALATQLRTEGARGLVYASVRKRGGICLVAFQPHLVQNVRPGARWKLNWTGTPDYSVAGA